MAQTLNSRIVNNFTGGLITEASQLKFPPNSSIDELNMDISIKGTRRRRRGLDYEPDHQNSTFTSAQTHALNTYVWKDAGEVKCLDFLVLHVGNELKFYLLDGPTVSTKERSFTVDLKDYKKANEYSLRDSYMDFAQIKGDLIVVSPAMNAITITYDCDAEVVRDAKIEFRTRDFDIQGDFSFYFNRSSNPTEERKYDTYNAGWSDKALQAYSDAISDGITAEQDSGFQNPYKDPVDYR